MHRIYLDQGTRPTLQAPYRAGHKARELIKAELDRLTSQGVIEPAISEWASPVLLVPKMEGTPALMRGQSEAEHRDHPRLISHSPNG